MSTYAGKSYGNINGNLQTAQFCGPRSLAFDPSGNLFIGDAGNNCIRKISTDGMVSTFGGSPYSYAEEGWADGPLEKARFPVPGTMVFNDDGSMYQCGIFQYSIRKISASGIVSEFVGHPYEPGYSNDTLTTARFGGIYGMIKDAAGNLYVADMGNHCIRKITPAGEVSTIAGKPGIPGFADGDTAARFNRPADLAFDRDGNLIVCDMYNNRIRKITQQGVVSTIAGNSNFGTMDGIGIAATMAHPECLAIDLAGNIFINGQGMGYIRKITPAGVVSKFAGNGQNGYVNGTGTQASFGYALGMAFNSTGDLFVADAENNTIRKITPAGVVSTYVGAAYTVPADGPVNDATFMKPTAMGIGQSGDMFVMDGSENNSPLLRKITTTGIVSTLAGGNTLNQAADGTGPDAGFYYPRGMAVNAEGNIFITDCNGSTIRKITPGGTVSTVAGKAWESSYIDGTASDARFKQAKALAFDPAGNMYVADQDGWCIRKITPSGTVSTFAGNLATPGLIDGTGSAAGFAGISSIAWGPDGNFYVADVLAVRRVSLNGEVLTMGASPFLGNYNGPCMNFSGWIQELNFDREGTMYITMRDQTFADNYISVVKKVSRQGLISTIAGSDSENGYADGDFSDARFYGIFSPVFDNANNMYLADANTRRIRKINIVPATGYIWNTGAATQYIVAKQSGNYSVRTIYGTCTSEAGNVIPVSAYQKPDKPVLNYSNDSLVVSRVTGDSAYQYYWYLDSVEISSTYENYITGISEGNYSVVAVNNGVCSSLVSEPLEVTGLSFSFSKKTLQIVPNPNSGIFSITGISNATPIRVINSLGQTVYQGHAHTETQLNLQNLPAGIYRLFAEGRQVPIVKTN
ncbi:MAG: T9SS type A sorting domain-containing protein [Bacteroidota bacterium]